MRKFGKFLFGAMLGGFFGSIIVLLFAPESGQETRDALRYRFQGLADQVKEAVNQRREEIYRELEAYKSGKE